MTFELIKEMVKVHPSSKFLVHVSNDLAVKALTYGTGYVPSTADAERKNSITRRITFLGLRDQFIIHAKVPGP